MLGKQQGVVKPASQLRELERGTPGKILSIVPLEQVAVRYAREDGVVVKEIWYRAGSDFYVHRDSEAFTNSLNSVKEGYAKQALVLLDAMRGSADAVPADDTVDVVSQETAEGT
ncbi:MAG: hypothetical protein WC372_08135 [Candidatus Neomarinimicrobiota bacterium]|jgi:hypothetical protein